MAFLYISEFNTLALAQVGMAPIAAQPGYDQPPIAITATSAQSQAFGSKMVRIHTDTPCSIVIGSNPTATTANMRLDSGQAEYFGVNPGDKLAVIANT